MEDALVRLTNFVEPITASVLILVVMEDALVLEYWHVVLLVRRVLILVVMEDALVRGQKDI